MMVISFHLSLLDRYVILGDIMDALMESGEKRKTEVNVGRVST